jgi:hypothetical protein
MTRNRNTGFARHFAAALLTIAAPATMFAQGNASSAATAMGGNYTAVARNFNTVAWNPANLALPGNSLFSLALSPQIGMGSGPLTLTDLKEYEGVIVPAGVREQWLQKIDENGGQDFGGDINITPLALSLGRIAFSATTTVRADGSLPTALAELVFFGNAGRTGTAGDLALDDLGLDANLTSTFALAYGRKFNFPMLPDLAIGVTGKYIIGHGMAAMRDNGSVLSSDPLSVILDAPIVLTDTAEVMNNGSGMGLDVGASWQFKGLRVGVVAHNLINTFEWNTENLYYVPVRATFDGDTSFTEVDSLLPLDSADPALQAELRGLIGEAKYTPTLAIGVAYTPFRMITVAADLKQKIGSSTLELGPDTQIGVGAELRLIPFIPFRAGLTTIGSGMRYSAGLALEFGFLNLQVAGQLQQADGRADTGGGFTLSIGGR